MSARVHLASPWPAWQPPLARRDDERFCIELLPAVSRTFALSIELLPPGLREPVRVGYLLCRILDTIEDELHLDRAQRDALFDAFDAALEGTHDEARALEHLADATNVGELAERRLILGAGAVFRELHELDAPVREVMVPPIREMSRGMRLYAHRAHDEGRLRLRDLPDLERYCYYVAGTVGELLTALFLRECALDGRREGLVRALAVPFGLALQVVNIVKDCAEDQTRGVCFLPEDIVRRHGLEVEQLVDPAHREAALGVIAELVVVARGYVEQAVAYTACWPASSEEGRAIRLFCIVPLVLALETLQVVLAGQDTLVPGRTPKVSRDVVRDVLDRCATASGSQEALAELLERYGFPVT